MKLTLTSVIPILLSSLFTCSFVWIETSNDKSNVLRDKLNSTFSKVDYMRYDLKSPILLDRIKNKTNKNKIVIIDIKDPIYLQDSSESTYEYVTIKRVIEKILKDRY